MSEAKLPYGTWLLVKVDFDNLENRLESAISKDIVGALKGTDDDVKKWVEENKPANKYKGWDGKEYPYYEATLLTLFELRGDQFYADC